MAGAKGKQIRHPFPSATRIGIYIADFVSLKNHLVIEIDGDYHLTPEQQELDHIRTIYMEQQGFRVIRFRNSQVLTDIESVMSKIIKSLI